MVVNFGVQHILLVSADPDNFSSGPVQLGTFITVLVSKMSVDSWIIKTTGNSLISFFFHVCVLSLFVCVKVWGRSP